EANTETAWKVYTVYGVARTIRVAISERDKVFKQQKVFLDLRKSLENLEKNSVTSLRSMINLGSEVYAQADVQIEEYTRLIAQIKAQIKMISQGIRELLQLPEE
ncbi:hypothetical protein Tco_1013282, partial [Tanacetum coccineum]